LVDLLFQPSLDSLSTVPHVTAHSVAGRTVALVPPAVQGVNGNILAILIILPGPIIAVGYLGGPRGALLATAGVLIMATVARLLAQYRRRSSAPRARADVAHACTALASYLRLGRCHLLRWPLPPRTVSCFARADRHTHPRRERGSCMAPAGTTCRAQRPS
jgi:hypothetical protein